MAIEVRVLAADEANILAKVASEVFDNPIDPTLANEFLAEPHCHLVAALENGVVVGFASAIDYIHPDKPRELWIDEVGVSPAHRQRGVGKALLAEVTALGHRLGCRQVWVLTEHENTAARALYTSAGAKDLGFGTHQYEWDL